MHTFLPPGFLACSDIHSFLQNYVRRFTTEYMSKNIFLIFLAYHPKLHYRLQHRFHNKLQDILYSLTKEKQNHQTKKRKRKQKSEKLKSFDCQIPKGKESKANKQTNQQNNE